MAINMQGTPWTPGTAPTSSRPDPTRVARRGYGVATHVGKLKPFVDLRAVDYERAAEIMRERGFTRGTGEEVDGSVCTGGAMAWAIFERLGNEEVSVNLVDMAREMELDEFAVPLWNDAPERTQDEVIERLEFAAKKLRNEGR